jgi:hypothetical protein
MKLLSGKDRLNGLGGLSRDPAGSNGSGSMEASTIFRSKFCMAITRSDGAISLRVSWLMGAQDSTAHDLVLDLRIFPMELGTRLVEGDLALTECLAGLVLAVVLGVGFGEGLVLKV